MPFQNETKSGIQDFLSAAKNQDSDTALWKGWHYYETARSVKFNRNFARPTSFEGPFTITLVKCTHIEQRFFYRATLKFPNVNRNMCMNKETRE